MSFWTPHQTTVYERIIIAWWRAWEVQVPLYDAPSWHIVGSLVETRKGKVSSALASLPPDTEEVTTKSGKIYLLEGEPGVNAEASKLWAAWQRQHDVTARREVTTDVIEGLQPGALHLRTPSR